MLLFIIFYIWAIFAERQSIKKKINSLGIVCLSLAFMAGFRNIDFWNDTGAYTYAFNYYTPTIFNYHSMSDGIPYPELGFYGLSVLIKTITRDSQLYLLFVSLFTFVFLFKDFKKYTPFPLLGVCVYISRFFLGRNFMQVRAGIAYAIILLGISYVKERNWKKYFIIVFCAYLFHKSALIAIPLYFMGCFKIKKQHVVALIGFAFILTAFFTPVLRQYVTDNASDLEVTNYVSGVEVEQAKGLLNPMIYYQCFWLFLFTFGESKLMKVIPEYFTIRNAYLLSTFILITFSMFLGLSGRTSTCFATLEFVIIPSISFLFRKRFQVLYFVLIGILLSVILYMNLPQS